METRGTHDLASLSRNAHEIAPLNVISVFHVDRARRKDAGTSRDATTTDGAEQPDTIHAKTEWKTWRS